MAQQQATTDPWAQAAQEYRQQQQPPAAATTPAAPGPAKGDAWSRAAEEYQAQTNNKSEHRGGPVSRFTGNFLSQLNPFPALKHYLYDIPKEQQQAVQQQIEAGDYRGAMGSILGNAVREAIPGSHLIPDVVRSQAHQFVRAYEDFNDKQGMPSLPARLTSAGGHVLAGLTPMVGPAAAEAGQQIGAGDVAGGLGAGAGLVAGATMPTIQAGASKAAAGAADFAVTHGPKFKMRLDPTEAAAIQEVQHRGIVPSLGQRTGNKFVRKGEDILQYVPGSASRSQTFFDAQREAVADELRKLPGEHTGGRPVTDATGAGEAIQGRIQDRMGALKSYADRQYDSVRRQLERHQEVTQKAAYDKAKAQWQQQHAQHLQQPLDPRAADPFTGEIPDESPELPKKPQFAAEVKLPAIRDDLRPLRDELAGSLSETKKANSPGWTVLNRIVEGKEDVADALVVDRDLGAIKAMLRRGEGQPMTPSDRYATRVVAKLEAGLEKSLNDVNPSLINRLKAGRRAVKEFHRNAELVQKLIPPGQSPVRAYESLARNGARQLPLLQEVKRIAPKEIETLGGTLLQGLTQGTISEGGLTRSATMLKRWNAIDDRVKFEIYGKPHTRSIDRFFLGVKKLAVDENPSSTARSKAVYIAINAGLGAAGAALMGHLTPLVGFSTTAASVNVLARILFSERGARLLADSVDLPFGTKGQTAAMNGVRQIAQQVSQTPPPRRTPPPTTGGRGGGPAGPAPTPAPPPRGPLRPPVSTAARPPTGQQTPAQRALPLQSPPVLVRRPGPPTTPTAPPPVPHAAPPSPPAAPPPPPAAAVAPVPAPAAAAPPAAPPPPPAAPVPEVVAPKAPPTPAKPPQAKPEAKPAEPPPVSEGAAPPALPSSLQKGAVKELTRHEIAVDPKRFQFKSKAIGKAGVTGDMADVESFDPEKAGVLSVWEDPKDHKTYVVNGHHRLERANALGYEGPLLVRYLAAKTAKEARTKGALINIAEGRGEPLDAAKIFREGGFGPEDLRKFGIDRHTTIAKQGLALSKLSDPVFEDVATGKIAEGRGAAIGDLLEDPADQEAAAKLSRDADARGKHLTDSEFRETLRLSIKGAPHQTETQETLFGIESIERNLGIEKGQISSYVKSQMATDKRLFATVSKAASAQKLQGAGNVLQTAKNASRAQDATQAIDYYERMSGVTGPINDILDEAAREWAEGGTASDVKQRAYQRISEVIGTDLSSLQRRGKGGTGAGVSGVAGQRGDPAEPTQRKRRAAAPPAEQPPAASPETIGSADDNAAANDAYRAAIAKAQTEAELNSPQQQGDPGAVVAESPLFRGEPIDTSDEQGSLLSAEEEE